MVLMAPVIAACANNHGSHVKRAAFTSKEFGVAVSPRVFTGKYPPRGGGRQMPANPYVVRGVTYKPVDGPGYVATGEASWYGQDFHGRRTANGEIFGAFSKIQPFLAEMRTTMGEPFFCQHLEAVALGAPDAQGIVDRRRARLRAMWERRQAAAVAQAAGAAVGS